MKGGVYPFRGTSSQGNRVFTTELDLRLGGFQKEGKELKQTIAEERSKSLETKTTAVARCQKDTLGKEKGD